MPGIQGYLNGASAASPTAEQVLATMVALIPGRIRMVAAATSGGSAGAADTIVDVRKNGLSVYGDPARRPTLPAGQVGMFATSYPPDNNTLRRGDVLSVVCAQPGVNAPVAATVAIEDP